MADSSKGVGKNAPKLVFIGDKWNNKGTYNEGSNPEGYFFGQQPSLIRDYIFDVVDGIHGNYLKIMWLLLSTKEGYKITQKWVLDTTRMARDKYYKARDELCDMNWLIYDADKEELGINYNFLWKQALLPKEEREDVLKWRKPRKK